MLRLAGRSDEPTAALRGTIEASLYGFLFLHVVPSASEYPLQCAYQAAQKHLVLNMNTKVTIPKEAQESFLAAISHEIRTPLNGVLGGAGLLAKTPLTPEQHHYLSAVQHSGHRLLTLLNDLLDSAQLMTGPLELALQPFNIGESVAFGLQPLVRQAAEEGLAFTLIPFCASSTDLWVVGDEQRVNQIIRQLVGNALKLTQRGGITVAGEQLAETADTLTLRFAVTDTGVDITPEQQQRIFQCFAPAQSDICPPADGLGLSLARALVTQLGGTLVVDSAEGRGSTFAFTVTLPKAEAPLTASGKELPDVATLQGWRVLLVDDNALNREIASAVLAQNGLIVDAAASGKDALTLFDQHRYEVVLMDIHMPGLNGLEATTRLRQHPDAVRAATPVLAMTASTFGPQHEGYKAAGLDGCVSKPFDEAELLRQLMAIRRLPSVFAGETPGRR